MAQGEYISTHLGAQVDAAVNAVANKQDTLVSGTNIKTINQTSVLGSGNIAVQETLVSGTNIKTINNTSLLGSGNITIQGGGSGDFSVRVIDATDPEDWDNNDGPSLSCIEDIATGDYQAVRLVNIPVDTDVPGSSYELLLILTAAIDIEGYQVREYYKFDSGDEEEGDPAFMQNFTFSKIDGEVSMNLGQYVLGGGGSSSSGIYFEERYIGGQDNDEVSLNLSEITDAIDKGSEVIIKVEAGFGYDTRYFRIETLPQNGKTSINDEVYWTPTFRCVDNLNEYYMAYDRFESEAFVFKIHEGAVRFAPTQIDIDKNEITFDSDDRNYIFNNQPKKITLNLDENSGEFWVDFNKVVVDDTPGEESYTYTSGIIPVSTDFLVFTFRIYQNGGNIETEITASQLTTTVPV